MQEPENRAVDRSLWMQILIFVATRLVFNTTHRMVYPFLRVFATGLGVELSDMALAMGLRSASGVFGPFLATVADSRGRKAGMLLGSALFIAGMLLPLFWPTFPAFILLLVLATVGYLVFIPSMQAYLGDRVHYRQRGLVLGLTELSWSLSFIIGIPLVKVLVERWGWRGPLPLLALLGLGGMLAIFWIVPVDSARSGVQPAWWKNFRLVMASPLALAGLGMGVLLTFSNELVNLIFSVWLEDSFHFSMSALAQVAVGIGVMELTGELLSTFLVDRMGKVTAIALGLLLGSGAALVLAIGAHTPPAALAGLFLFYLAFEFTIVSSMPLMSEILPAARATLMAANIALISLGRSVGAFFTPGLYTWGQSFFPHLGLTSIGANALLAAIFNLAALVLLLRLRRVDKAG